MVGDYPLINRITNIIITLWQIYGLKDQFKAHSWKKFVFPKASFSSQNIVKKDKNDTIGK